MAISIQDFFNNDYITFASYDNTRKLSSLVDGLKISQRKVLYTVLKNNINCEKNEIKVEQLSAKTSEQTQYLHGANSLNGVAVGLAVKYTGSNNINILEPDGNFGTRFINDSSAPRYIYTYLSDIAKYIFKKEDEQILQQLTFEGQKIEPKYFYPIIPLVLVNGTNGVSVGFSSNIAPRNVYEIIDWLENKLKNKNKKFDLLPFYRGFKGDIKQDVEQNKYLLFGKYKKINNNKLLVYEIPIKYNLNNYIKILDSLCENDVIKNYKDLSDNDNFNFEINVKREFFEKSELEILKTLKLIETISDNYTLLDSDGKVKEYSNVEQILNDYYAVRYNAYNLRKQYILQQFINEIKINKNKINFIKSILSKKININDNIKNIIKYLENLNFDKINDCYDYLFDIKIYNFTKEKVEALNNKIQELQQCKDKLEQTKIEDIWLDELKQLKKELNNKWSK